MIKRITLTAVTIFAGVAIGVLLAFAGHSSTLAAQEPESPPQAQVPQNALPVPGPVGEAIPEASGSSGEAGGYFIREYKGRVSVMQDGSDVPEMVFDIQTKLLPELDRQQLSQGIYVATYEELIRLVEDYIS